jgi:hypothetical protein
MTGLLFGHPGPDTSRCLTGNQPLIILIPAATSTGMSPLPDSIRLKPDIISSFRLVATIILVMTGTLVKLQPRRS